MRQTLCLLTFFWALSARAAADLPDARCMVEAMKDSHGGSAHVTLTLLDITDRHSAGEQEVIVRHARASLEFDSKVENFSGNTQIVWNHANGKIQYQFETEQGPQFSVSINRESPQADTGAGVMAMNFREMKQILCRFYKNGQEN